MKPVVINVWIVGLMTVTCCAHLSAAGLTLVQDGKPERRDRRGRGAPCAQGGGSRSRSTSRR